MLLPSRLRTSSRRNEAPRHALYQLINGRFLKKVLCNVLATSVSSYWILFEDCLIIARHDGVIVSEHKFLFPVPSSADGLCFADPYYLVGSQKSIDIVLSERYDRVQRVDRSRPRFVATGEALFVLSGSSLFRAEMIPLEAQVRVILI